MDRKTRLVLLVGLILVAGFVATGLISYYTSLAFVRDRITESSLPITSDNVYSEIQRDLIRPVFMSSMMANDTFLKAWVTAGERDPAEVTRYLRSLVDTYGTFTSFFVSESTRIYYHADGILKTVHPDSSRDRWYFRVRQMEPMHEINVDPDMANRDALTIFVNHKVTGDDGEFLGATGVGLAVNAGAALMRQYRSKYGRDVYFVDAEGRLMLDGESAPGERNIRTMDGIASIADRILSDDKMSTHSYERDGRRVYVNSRLIPELGWHLIVEEAEAASSAHISRSLMINLGLWAAITGVVILLTALTINTYQKDVDRQQREIVDQHDALEKKNAELTLALAEVKKLSGLLPICASCKKIRDDKGYWQQIETYIREHSEVEFSHGICPDCSRVIYPEFADNAGSGEKSG